MPETTLFPGLVPLSSLILYISGMFSVIATILVKLLRFFGPQASQLWVATISWLLVFSIVDIDVCFFVFRQNYATNMHAMNLTTQVQNMITKINYAHYP